MVDWEFNEHLRWIKTWMDDMLSGPCTQEDLSHRLKVLLDSNESTEMPKGVDRLCALLAHADWSARPDKFDNIWRAVFDEAGRRGWTYDAREALYSWADLYMGKTASDYEPDDIDEAPSGDEVYDDFDIAIALGNARLYSLGYTYSSFAYARLSDGLGLSPDDDDSKAHNPARNSDTQRIASCAQLLGGGRRLKLAFDGGGDHTIEDNSTAHAWLGAPSKEEITPESKAMNEKKWKNIIDSLFIEQKHARPRAAKLLQITLEHLQSSANDLTSEEVAALVWPGRQFGPADG